MGFARSFSLLLSKVSMVKPMVMVMVMVTPMVSATCEPSGQSNFWVFVMRDLKKIQVSTLTLYFMQEPGNEVC